jgi:hypothetical protein
MPGKRPTESGGETEGGCQYRHVTSGSIVSTCRSYICQSLICSGWGRGKGASQVADGVQSLGRKRSSDVNSLHFLRFF